MIEEKLKILKEMFPNTKELCIICDSDDLPNKATDKISFYTGGVITHFVTKEMMRKVIKNYFKHGK